MDFMVCPFCDIRLSSSQLQWHANSHFEDDSTTIQSLKDGIEEGSGSGSGYDSISEKVNLLVDLQIRSDFHRIENGLMVLLRRCLESSEPENTVTVLSGHVDHFQTSRLEDSKWGCGWRNIQSLCSHLLEERSREAGRVLFGGSGFVPDIPSLQRWLELAWEKGFDKPGSEQFENCVYGTEKWIGTTECAALLRSFGVRAMVVDFGPRECESVFMSVPGTSLGVKRKGFEVRGPMDRFVISKGKDRGETCASKKIDGSSGDGNSNSGESKGLQVLIDWLWNYFSDKKPVNYSSTRRVTLTEKAPLYFQHDGHSRTIIGIQAKYQRKGTPQYTLLILDPSHRTVELEKALKENVGWQKLLKRGVHTLKKPQYQLCYVEPGISNQEEMESLKTINSTFFEV